MIYIGSNKLEIAIIKVQLKNQFKLKNLGQLNYFLGIYKTIQVTYIFIRKKIYFKDWILEEIWLLGTKPFKIPMEAHIDLRNDKSKPIDDPTFYRKMMRKLIYINITRSDLTLISGSMTKSIYE